MTGGRRFEARLAAGWKHEPLPGASAADLASEVPLRVRNHAGAAAFLNGAEHIAATVAQLRSEQSRLTLAARRDTLQGVEEAAHAMQNSLSDLANGSDPFEDLALQAEYVLLRTREGSQGAPGRPVVPALPGDVPNVDELLARLDTDLASLRALCSYSAGQLNADRNPPRGAERLLVEMLAQSHSASFGMTPRPRGWFADFARAVGERIGLNIGQKVITAVLTGKPAPRRKK